MQECNHEPWFKFEVMFNPEQPDGFEDWINEGITQKKYNIYLPDGTKTHAKLFMDHQKIFNNYDFTNYLVNRYEEL